ncbi:MAG: Ppx/GppA family phosphatase, partial [Brevundimonas sp.]|nr:Ppx/GppA family phosphatase [Brevundimonas sp.]
MPEALLSAIGAPRDVAAIDIGSNSVRLVLYRLEGRAIWTVFNEKVLAGLGRDLATTGRLSVEGAAQALTALKRFAAVIEGVQPAHTFVAATAAVREAADGREFCDRVAAETGLRIRVLSGEEEARYAALGVLAGAPQATGVVGDLGGASLELVRLSSTGAGRGVTLPLGPFSLAGPNG